MAFARTFSRSATPILHAPLTIVNYRVEGNSFKTSFRPSYSIKKPFKHVMSKKSFGMTRKSGPTKLKFIPRLAFAFDTEEYSDPDSNKERLFVIPSMIFLMLCFSFSGALFFETKYIKYWFALVGIVFRDLLFLSASELTAFFLTHQFSKFSSSLQFNSSKPFLWPPGLLEFKKWMLVVQVGSCLIFTLLAIPYKILPLAGFTLLPYLILIGFQEVYERFTASENILTLPIMPIMFSFCRMHQLYSNFIICFDSVDMLSITGVAPATIEFLSRLLIFFCIFNLAVYLTYLPWIFRSKILNDKPSLINSEELT